MNASILERTVGDLVAERPGRAKIFEKLGIDYCCKGNMALAVACEAKGADASSVAAQMEAEAAKPGEGPDAPWRQSVDSLVDHVISKHHAYMREALPRLEWITDKMAKVHGDRDTRLPELAAAFKAFAQETEEHLNKEEMILFPFCKLLEKGQRPPFPPTVTLPVRTMMREHEDHGAALESFRRLTDGFAVPEGACNTWRAMLDGLQELEGDLYTHIHLENTVLFPWAERLEAALGVDPVAFAHMSCKH
jgi:regulator of cell morphogenesis and NO signaling